MAFNCNWYRTINMLCIAKKSHKSATMQRAHHSEARVEYRQQIPNFIRSFRCSAALYWRCNSPVRTMPLRLRNTYRKAPPARLRKSPSQQRGWLRSINIFTTVMNSNVPPGRFSDAPVKLRVPAHSKSTSIDQPSALRKLVERVSSSLRAATALSLRWKSLPRPFWPHAHTSAKMRAQTWPSTYRIRFFVWHYGVLTWRANA